MPGNFFDANLLLHVASGDPAKADRAGELIGACGTISVQVRNEIADVARRKMGMSWTATSAFLSTIAVCCRYSLSPSTYTERNGSPARRALWTVDLRCHDRRRGAARPLVLCSGCERGGGLDPIAAPWRALSRSAERTAPELCSAFARSGQTCSGDGQTRRPCIGQSLVGPSG
jgi:hypothetical protein